jgi:hypothetical protein
MKIEKPYRIPSSASDIITAASFDMPVEAMAIILSSGWEISEGADIFNHITYVIIIRKGLAPGAG